MVKSSRSIKEIEDKICFKDLKPGQLFMIYENRFFVKIADVIDINARLMPRHTAVEVGTGNILIIKPDHGVKIVDMIVTIKRLDA